MCSRFSPAAFSGDADGGCQCQLASLQSIDKEDGIEVIGITGDTPFVMGPWSEAAGIKCLCDTKLEVVEKYVGTIDFGKFLDDLDVSTNMAGYMSSKRGCVVLDEDQKVTTPGPACPTSSPRPPRSRPRSASARSASSKNGRRATGARERGERT